jgi:hypothetical protein
MKKCSDGCHIPLYEKRNERKTLVVGEFFNRKNFHSLLLQACDSDNFFGTAMVSSLVDVQMVEHLSFQTYALLCEIS